MLKLKLIDHRPLVRTAMDLNNKGSEGQQWKQAAENVGLDANTIHFMKML